VSITNANKIKTEIKKQRGRGKKKLKRLKITRKTKNFMKKSVMMQKLFWATQKESET
jgi:hypothetical protein